METETKTETRDRECVSKEVAHRSVRIYTHTHTKHTHAKHTHAKHTQHTKHTQKTHTHNTHTHTHTHTHGRSIRDKIGGGEREERQDKKGKEEEEKENLKRLSARIIRRKFRVGLN
jgi:hypothetical protein